MRTRRVFFALVVVLAAAVLLLLAPQTQADVDVSLSESVHNQDDLTRIATNLEYTVRMVNWEGKNAPYDYWFTSISPSTTPSGTPTITARWNNDTPPHIYAYDISVTGLHIPYCTSVRIDVSATLNRSNTIVIDTPRFTYSSAGGSRKLHPNGGFEFADQHEWLGFAHVATYNYVNEDSAEAVTLRELAFYMDTSWHDPNTQWQYHSWTYLDSLPGPYIVAPGARFTHPLNIPPTQLDSTASVDNYIYVRGVAEYQMPYMTSPENQPFRQGHQEYTTGWVPAVSHIGLLVLALIVGLTGLILLIRARRRSVA